MVKNFFDWQIYIVHLFSTEPLCQKVDIRNFVENKSISGYDKMRRMTMEVNAVVNEMNRPIGLAPVQWVLGRRPRYSAGEQGDDEQDGQLGGLEQRADPNTIFGRKNGV